MHTTPTKPIIRCSSLDRVLACRHSLDLPSEPSDSPYATAGTNAHAALAHILRGETVPTKLTTAIGVTDLSAVRAAAEQIRRLKPHTDASMHIEERMTYIADNYSLTGQPDVFFLSVREWDYMRHDNIAVFNDRIDTECEIVVIDYKHGHVPVSVRTAQLQGYAALIAESCPDRDRIDHWNITVAVAQHSEIKTHTYTKSQLDTFLSDLELLISDPKQRTWITGDHCRYCPHKFHCTKMRDTLSKPYFDEHRIMVERNKTSLEAMIEENHQYLIDSRPELFDQKIRRTKEWLREHPPLAAPKPFTVAAALKAGHDLTEGADYKINENISYKLR